MNDTKTEYCAKLCSSPTCFPPKPVPPTFQHQQCAIICKSTLDGYQQYCARGASPFPRR